MTSVFQEMEDDLTIFGNGRRPQFFRKWKTTSTFQEIKDTSIHQEIEDNLLLSGNGRQLEFSEYGRQLKFSENWRSPQYQLMSNIAKLSPRSSFSLTELALFPLYYHQHPPTRNSFKLTWNENQTSQIGFNKLQMEDDLNFQKNGRRPQFSGKWKTTSTFFLVN